MNRMYLHFMSLLPAICDVNRKEKLARALFTRADLVKLKIEAGTWLPFNPYYFCYAEDLEFSLRTILLGG